MLSHLVDAELLLRGAAPDLTGRAVELRSMPEALDTAAYAHAVSERPTTMRAAVVEGSKPALESREHDSLPVHDQQLHLVFLQFVGVADDERLGRGSGGYPLPAMASHS